MTSTQDSVLLRRGGMVPAPVPPGEQHGATIAAPRIAEVPKYNGALDPAGVEELGRRLADKLRQIAVDAVLIWEDVEDLVLAHVVARELGVHVVRAFDADGLVMSVGRIDAGDNVVVLADTFRDATVLDALRSLVHSRAAAVAALATLVHSPLTETAAGPVVSLAAGLDTGEIG